MEAINSFLSLMPTPYGVQGFTQVKETGIQTRLLAKLACQAIVSDSRILVLSQTVLPDSLKAAVITEAENVMKEVINRSVMTCHLCLEIGITPKCTICDRINTLQIIRQQTEHGLQILKAKMSKMHK